MPKEWIIGESRENQPFMLAVGWDKDHDMRVGIQVVDRETDILHHLFGGDPESLRSVGAAFHKWLYRGDGLPIMPQDFRSSDEQDKAFQEAGASVLELVAGTRTFIERDGVWVNIDRRESNGFIQLLRRGRDSAYGKDQ